MKKTVRNAGLVYTILLIVFAAFCVLGYSLYLIYKLGKVLKSNSNEETPEVAKGSEITLEKSGEEGGEGEGNSGPQEGN